jgi:hypothetical protein
VLGAAGVIQAGMHAQKDIVAGAGHSWKVVVDSAMDFLARLPGLAR